MKISITNFTTNNTYQIISNFIINIYTYNNRLNILNTKIIILLLICKLLVLIIYKVVVIIVIVKKS